MYQRTFFCQDFQSQEECDIAGGKAYDYCTETQNNRKNLNRVIKMVETKGLEAHVVRGEEMTIIGCIGDTVRIDPRLFEVDQSVDKVMHVQEPYKLANRAFHPEDTIIDVSAYSGGRRSYGNDRRTMFCGE